MTKPAAPRAPAADDRSLAALRQTLAETQPLDPAELARQLPDEGRIAPVLKRMLRRGTGGDAASGGPTPAATDKPRPRWR